VTNGTWESCAGLVRARARARARRVRIGSRKFWPRGARGSAVPEAALTAARRDDLQHGTNAAYVHGCVCRDCREHQQRRLGRIGT
jgi:hypothetical protein